MLDLTVWQQFLNARHIALGNNRIGAKMPLSLGALLGQDMRKVGLTAFDAALCGRAEAFRRRAISLHLRHFLLRIA